MDKWSGGGGTRWISYFRSTKKDERKRLYVRDDLEDWG